MPVLPRDALEIAVQTLVGNVSLSVVSSYQSNIYSNDILLADSESLSIPENIFDCESDIESIRGYTDLWAAAKLWHSKEIRLELFSEYPEYKAELDAMELLRLELLMAANMRGAGHNINLYHSNTSQNNNALFDIIRSRVKEKSEHIYVDELLSLVNEQLPYGRVAYKIIQEIISQTKNKASKESNNSNLQSNNTKSIAYDSDDILENSTVSSEETENIKTDITQNDDFKPEARHDFKISELSENISHTSKGTTHHDEALYNVDHNAILNNSTYKIYTAKYDEIVNAYDLAEEKELLDLRNKLDDKINNLNEHTSIIARKLRSILLAKQKYKWKDDEEHGVINPSRLAGLVASPENRNIFRTKENFDSLDTIVTLLFDNSGSMRGRPMALAAMTADILAKTLESSGVSVEILGFTTSAWQGGKSLKLWQENGAPENPGRLNDLRHIIYKSANTPYRKAKKHLGLMLKDNILKENIDGEALLWAESRLQKRLENRKILIVISDGAPVDDATLSNNPSTLLDAHLREVINKIESSREVELLAIGIGHDVTRYYKHSITIRDASTLIDTISNELIDMFKRNKMDKI